MRTASLIRLGFVAMSLFLTVSVSVHVSRVMQYRPASSLRKLKVIPRRLKVWAIARAAPIVMTRSFTSRVSPGERAAIVALTSGLLMISIFFIFSFISRFVVLAYPPGPSVLADP